MNVIDLLVPVLAALWLARMIRAPTSGPKGYTVKGGRMIRWISEWTCKDCGTHNTCPRRGAGLRCKRCKSGRDASVRFWFEQSRLPKGLGRRPGQQHPGAAQDPS